MPTFDTPEPIAMTVEIGVGDIRIAAGERTDTVVEVRPSNSARKSDVVAAQQTRVEYVDGTLLVKAPKGWRPFSLFGGSESIDVHIEVPAGSHLRGDAAVAALRCVGRLGECHFRNSVGDLHVAEAGRVQLKTSSGDITVETAGDAELTCSSGAVRVDSIDGTGVIKNSNGSTWIGRAAGDLQVNASNGKIVVEHAQAAVTAKTANGDVRLMDVRRGAVLAQTSRGNVDVGIHDGVAAWLDLGTSLGRVHNDLDAAGCPEAGEEAVEVRARSSLGDITIRRAPSS